MDPYRNGGMPSPTTSRFPAGARGGNFLPPVSGPPTPNRMQMRRPSQNAMPSPREGASPSHTSTLSPGGPSPRTPSGAVDRQQTLALGSPPVWRSEGGPEQHGRADQVVLGKVIDGPPGTPARKASDGFEYGGGRSPGYGLGISSPSGQAATAAPPSTVSPGPLQRRMSRVPSQERMQASVSPRIPLSQPSPRQRAPAPPSPSVHHAKSPSVPLSHFSPDPARRAQERQTSDPNFKSSQAQQSTYSPGPSSAGRLGAAERKISVSLERDGSDPAISSPLSHYPSAVNGKPPSSTPPARPRHASADLIQLPHQREPPLTTPPHTKIDRARDSRLGSGSNGSASKILSAGRASMDENVVLRSPVSADRRSGSAELGKKKADSPKSLTPRKSSGVLRSLFGKKKDAAPASPTAKSPTATSFPVAIPGGPSTPWRLNGLRDFEPPSRPSPAQPSTTPPGGRMSRPRTGSSPSLPAPGPPPRRPSGGQEYQLSAPPAPQNPLPSLLSTDSTGLLSSSDSIPSLQARDPNASGRKAVNILRRLSDQSSHSASSLSYLASEPSAASNRAPPDLPHLKSSGSLRLLALPDFGGSLDLGQDVGMLAEALSQPVENGTGSFQPQLDGEDSWSSLLAAMSSGSPEMITAAFEGARQSIALQNNSELDRALADLQLEVNKQVSNLPGSRSLDAVDTEAAAQPPAPAPSPGLPSPSPPLAPVLETEPIPPTTPAAPIKNPNLTIAVVKPPPTSFKFAQPPTVAPLSVAKRTLSAPTVSPDQATGLYSSPTSDDAALAVSPTRSSAATDQAVPVMTSASLPSLRSRPTFRPAPFNGRILTIAAARRERKRKILNYRMMAEKMGDCLVAVRSSSARAPLIRGVLLPLLYDLERCGYDPSSFAENKLMRACCFEWLVGLVTKDLWLDHTPSERGAILEAVATLVESPALSERALASDPADAAVFRKILRTVVSFVMIKLSSKGIFQNTLSFAGRMLAFAFFRVEGIAQQLLSSMPITRMALVRMETQLHETEARSPRLSYKHESEPFPSFLAPFSLKDPRDYVEELNRSFCYFGDPEDEAAFRFQPGNWLRRWQSDDSELFFSFFRAYHRRLSTFFPSVQDGDGSESLVTSVLFKAPGYAHLATVFTSKCVSYVQGKINSVTTTSSAATFNSTETAGFAGSSGKPPVLESANRRLSETIILLLTSPTIVDVEFGTEVSGARLFGLVSELWFRILVGRTNMYEPKGVFCLFDLLDVVTTVPPNPYKEMTLVHSPPLAFTTIFLISPLSILLRNSDHALTLCKCVSYVFQHWDTLTADTVDRSALVDLLLDQVVFDRLALFWSQSVRSYVVRLIVFRLSHISQRAGGPTPAEVHMVATLNSRLERIRRRHADLEPSVLGTILEDDTASSLAPPPSPGLKRSRSTIAMVRLPSEASNLAADEYVPSGDGRPAGPAARPASVLDPGAEIMAGAGGSAVGKATQWFKRSFGGGSAGGKKKRGSGDDLSSQLSSKTLTGITEDASEGATSPISPAHPLPRSPSATTTQHPPLFSALPAPAPQQSMLSPARSSFESSGLPSPADFFFSEEEERKLATADAFQPSGLALPGATLPRNNPFINASLAANPPPSPTTSLASYTFGSRGSTDSTYSSDTATPTAAQSPSNPTGVFSFGFAASPVSDSFEINASAPTVPSIVLPSGQSAHPPPSPISPTSNRMSRSFSRRSTLLTPLASHILEDLANAGEEPSKISAAFAAQREKDAGYDKKLHPYAVQFLAELELTMEEYAEWYGPAGAGTLSADGAPPRLSVGWNFHDDE